MSASPFELLDKILAQVRALKLPEAESEAMTLATADRRGRPSARVVLLKGVRDGALEFYTGFESRKGRELIENPYASVVMHWPRLGIQVRVEGRVERMSDAESDRYWSSRARESQLSACVSRQGRVIRDRASLLEELENVRRLYPGDSPIPRPDHWGGFRLVADSFEFWTAVPNRLHERHVYQREGSGWKHSMLSP